MDQNLPIVSVKNEVISATKQSSEPKIWPLALILLSKKWYDHRWNRLFKTNRLVVLSIIKKKQTHSSGKAVAKRNTESLRNVRYSALLARHALTLVWSLENVHYKTFGVRTIVLTATYTLFGSTALESLVGTSVVDCCWIKCQLLRW